MLQGSEVPYFEKKMTHPMLQNVARASIPASFILAHCHMLHSVISLMGPIGHAHSVAIKTYPSARGSRSVRVYLSAGWKEFVKENGFRVGDCVLFRLVETSCFLVSLKLQQNAVYKSPPLSKCFKERALGKFEREDHGNIPQTKVPRQVTINQGNTGLAKCEFSSNPAEISIQVAGDNMRDEGVVVYPYPRELHCVKYPGFEAAVSSNSRFPQFISKLTKTNLGDHVELPIQFAEYGHKLQARVLLLGPYGLWKIVKLRVSSTVCTTIRMQFRHGWKNFALENGFEEGDSLLFSLVGLSKFVVQLFTKAKRLQ